jgi:hypothetical protein
MEDDPKMDIARPISLTLPADEWRQILFLVIQGGKTVISDFATGKAHTPECVASAASAAKSLHELYESATTVTPNTLRRMN